MTEYSAELNGIKVVLHKEVLSKRNENTRFSHFDGKPDDLLKVVIASWCDGRFRRCDGFDDRYAVQVFPGNFFCKKGAVRVTDRIDYDFPRYQKKPAAKAFVIVRVVARSGGSCPAVKMIEIIDIQAEPVVSVPSTAVAPETRA